MSYFNGDIIDGMNVYNLKEKSGRTYQYIIQDHKRIRLHTYLAENYLIHRKLYHNEVVHHKDINPLNNQLDNLQVMTRSEHMKLHKPSLGYKITEEQRKHLSDAHKGYKVKDATKAKLKLIMQNRVITWQDKITLAKTKVHKEDIVKLIQENPNITKQELQDKLHIKSYMPIYKFGGLKKLKKEVLSA